MAAGMLMTDCDALAVRLCLTACDGKCWLAFVVPCGSVGFDCGRVRTVAAGLVCWWLAGGADFFVMIFFLDLLDFFCGVV
jgi:hypothetical protein